MRIADINIKWLPGHDDFMADFGVDDNNLTPDISFTSERKTPGCHGISFIPEESAHVLLSHNSSDILCADNNWENAVLYSSFYTDSDYTLPLSAVCSRLAYYNCLPLHGAFVDCNASGIVFTGYSGVGKTTQALLWEKHKNAAIVNGDKVFLREVDGGFFAYGSPWKGSSPYRVNHKAPVKAIVILQQAQTNSIKKLSEKECLELLLPHIFLPHWDKNCVSRVLDTFEGIIKNTNVFLLECRPDEESVDITYKKIFG